MKRLLSTMSALLIALVLPLALPEANVSRPSLTLAQEMNFTVAGKITRHEGSKLTLNTEANIILHVTYNEKTEITRADGSSASSRDLQVGKNIHVDGDLQESGEIVAHKIAILKEAEKH
jgi:hypothetical protein